ncbi:hypothetical protein CLOSTASPAR_02732 [[Clostridium] asparagiforme DSM 15981]|uniref:Uncharacterized protein n=1 Tax=[Clostridium] asparagiforme DSM 15981 TaxID=518636 RepID=C0D0E6_9FIRM|nr:hypothetical protein CLOSTASPAR_02732 [[Clostridium] asparagiforme DSM 15981]
MTERTGYNRRRAQQTARASAGDPYLRRDGDPDRTAVLTE